MIKFLISIYIAAVLLFAGFAAEANTLHFERIKSSSKVWLNVHDASFDSRKEILTLSGVVSSECLKTINPELSLNKSSNEVLVSVTASGENCLSDSRNYYEIVIDLKAFMASKGLSEVSRITFHIDNYVGGDSYSFNYVAQPQLAYSFDQNLEGQVEIDHRTGKFFLVSQNGLNRIQILSRFDLFQYVNRFVQIKGLIPGKFTIGDGAIPSTTQLIVGQLTALR